MDLQKLEQETQELRWFVVAVYTAYGLDFNCLVNEALRLRFLDSATSKEHSVEDDTPVSAKQCSFQNGAS